jgi:hypothetical protein
LVDKSMLVGHTDHAPVRFSMLETLRAYGRERLAEQGEAVNACAAHAIYHVEFAEAADVGLRGAEEGAWAQALAGAFDDLRSAHQWSLIHRPELAMRLSARQALRLKSPPGPPGLLPPRRSTRCSLLYSRRRPGLALAAISQMRPRMPAAPSARSPRTTLPADTPSARSPTSRCSRAA